MESAVDAGVDDDGSNSDGDSSHSSNKSSSQNSDLSWVQLIEIDVEIGVFEWNGESEEKYECKDSNTVPNIDLFLYFSLLPDEDEGHGADESEEEASIGSCSSFDSGDHDITERIGYNFWDSNNQSIDIEAEVKLIEHQSWGIELKDNGTLHDNQHDGHQPKWFKSEQIENREPFSFFMHLSLKFQFIHCFYLSYLFDIHLEMLFI